MGVMDEAVENGVGQGRITQRIVPVGDRQLTGDDGGPGLVAFIQQFKQIPSSFIVEQRQSPIIQLC